MRGLVIKNTGSWYLVKTDEGQCIECKVKGNFRLKGIRSTNPVAVGDYVQIIQNKEGTAFITEIEDRKNYIIRRASNLSKQSHIIASNLDQCMLIVTVNYPETSTTFIDRFLASAEAYRIPVRILFNKIDAYDEDELQEFLKMAADAAKLIAEKAPADVAALSALELEGKTLDAIRTALVGKIGENMTFRRFKRLEAKGKLHKYVHGGSKIATLVDVEGGDDEVAHDIAMHIAASKPKALNAEGIDPALIETERRVAIEKAKEAGKPEAMLERIADGTVKKFLKEVTLLDQPFVKDDKVTIAQLLKSKNANVADFALFVVGEGLEKRNDDFAAEVAAQTAAAQKA